MNQRQRQLDGLQRRSDTIPYYRRDKQRKHRGEWVVYVDGRKEDGDIERVCGEFAKTGLYYPFHLCGKEIEGWEHHAHDFAGVLRTLLEQPAIFNIHGFEEYYAEQQIEFLDAVQKRLLAMKEAGRNNVEHN